MNDHVFKFIANEQRVRLHCLCQSSTPVGTYGGAVIDAADVLVQMAKHLEIELPQVMPKGTTIRPCEFWSFTHARHPWYDRRALYWCEGS